MKKFQLCLVLHHYVYHILFLVNPTPKLATGKGSSSAESENQKNGYPQIPEQPTEEDMKTAGLILKGSFLYFCYIISVEL